MSLPTNYNSCEASATIIVDEQTELKVSELSSRQNHAEKPADISEAERPIEINAGLRETCFF